MTQATEQSGSVQRLVDARRRVDEARQRVDKAQADAAVAERDAAKFEGEVSRLVTVDRPVRAFAVTVPYDGVKTVVVQHVEHAPPLVRLVEVEK